MKNLFLIGGGGHCKACIDVIESMNAYKIKGIFDIKDKLGQEILGYKIIGTDEDIKKYQSDENYFLITVGQIKSPELRKKLFNLDLNLATIISTRAYVSKHAIVDSGSIIMHDALVNANAKVGKNCIINSKALIEHDAVIEDHSHIATGAVVNGHCHVKAGSFIGSNTVLRQGTVIEENSVISFGGKV